MTAAQREVSIKPVVLDWVRVDVGYYSHRKTLHLCDLLSEPLAYAYPPRGWAYALNQARDGVVDTRYLGALESFMGWRGKRGELVEALLEVGFLDQVEAGVAFHGWMERQGKDIAQSVKEIETKRWKRAQEAAAREAERLALTGQQPDKGRRRRGAPAAPHKADGDVEDLKQPPSEVGAERPTPLSPATVAPPQVLEATENTEATPRPAYVVATSSPRQVHGGAAAVPQLPRGTAAEPARDRVGTGPVFPPSPPQATATPPPSEPFAQEAKTEARVRKPSRQQAFFREVMQPLRAQALGPGVQPERELPPGPTRDRPGLNTLLGPVLEALGDLGAEAAYRNFLDDRDEGGPWDAQEPCPLHWFVKHAVARYAPKQLPARPGKGAKAAWDGMHVGRAQESAAEQLQEQAAYVPPPPVCHCGHTDVVQVRGFAFCLPHAADHLDASLWAQTLPQRPCCWEGCDKLTRLELEGRPACALHADAVNRGQLRPQLQPAQENAA